MKSSLICFASALICAFIIGHDYPEFYWPSCVIFLVGFLTGCISLFFWRQQYVD